MFIHFDSMYERDRHGQTDGQTDEHCVTAGATENAGLELNGPTKFGGWKMQDWN